MACRPMEPVEPSTVTLRGSLTGRILPDLPVGPPVGGAAPPSPALSRGALPAMMEA
jgi:hypothetical protein